MAKRSNQVDSREDGQITLSGKNAAVFTPNEFSSDEELVGLLDLKAFARVWHELTIA